MSGPYLLWGHLELPPYPDPDTGAPQEVVRARHLKQEGAEVLRRLSLEPAVPIHVHGFLIGMHSLRRYLQELDAAKITQEYGTTAHARLTWAHQLLSYFINKLSAQLVGHVPDRGRREGYSAWGWLPSQPDDSYWEACMPLLVGALSDYWERDQAGFEGMLEVIDQLKGMGSSDFREPHRNQHFFAELLGAWCLVNAVSGMDGSDEVLSGLVEEALNRQIQNHLYWAPSGVVRRAVLSI